MVRRRRAKAAASAPSYDFTGGVGGGGVSFDCVLLNSVSLGSGKPSPMLSGFLSLSSEVRGKIKTSRESYNYSPRT